MATECNPQQLEFQALGRREVIGRFDGGRITSDGGGLLLREVDNRLGLLERLAGCSSDYRNRHAIEYSVSALVAQRVYCLALGYEDLNDHDVLRKDSVLALLVGIQRRRVNWILDADYRSFFDRISHEWLIRFLENRIGDQRVIRLIRKWLKAGVLDDGIIVESEAGTPQGATISPLLANVYLLRGVGVGGSNSLAPTHDKERLRR